ncbi:MAG: type II secretion system protein [Fidelibacterota bacterium]
MKNQRIGNKMKMMAKRQGFTLMELVVTTAIVGTLAAFAVPSYIEAGNNAKGAKSLDNVNNIGSAIIQEYIKRAPYGDGTNAIATFAAVADDSVKAETQVIKYLNNGVETFVTFADIFPGGVPESPFDNREYLISAVTAGAGEWTTSGGIVTLTVTTQPSITIEDPSFSQIANTFTP